MTAPIHQPDFVSIGRVARPHGVRGELRIEATTDDPSRFGALEFVLLGRNADKLERFDVRAARMHHNQVLLQLEGVDSREAAGRLRSLTVFVPIEEAIPLDEGEFFIFQLYGMQVVSDSGEPLGTIEDVIQTSANDVFVVRGDAYGEILLPDTEEVVLSIDGDQRVVTVRLIPGLLPPPK